MERALHWVLVLTVSASFIISNGLSHSRLLAADNYERADRMLANNDVSGFISIDCGSNADYEDKETGIWYKTDKNFVETGYSRMVPGSANLDYYPYYGTQLRTLRCFPEGERNCYTLRGKNNSRYLIRAFSSYGNYDGKNQSQSFDLYLGVNLWKTISFDSDVDFQFSEIIHTASSDNIQVCLVKTGPTIPCISLLELRPLDTSIYLVNSSTNPQRQLRYDSRIDVGSLARLRFSRYKDDVYDRIWRKDSDLKPSNWHNLELDNSTDIDPGAQYDAYKVPTEVLRTAAQSQNISCALEFNYNSAFEDSDDFSDYHVYFHFAEIKQLPVGKKRIINSITLNSESILSQPVVLEYLKPVTIGPGHTAQGNVILSITAASESDAPPILNALEVYKLIPAIDSPTDASDVGAMMDIKVAYHISRLNWQGDPCRPMQYAWDGLSCSSDTIARITALNLSSSRLTGQIDTSFSYLTELVILDLSYNELDGPLPEFLAKLPKLKVLNLTGNKLSGLIPKALKEKENTTLQLRFLLQNFIFSSSTFARR